MAPTQDQMCHIEGQQTGTVCVFDMSWCPGVVGIIRLTNCYSRMFVIRLPQLSSEFYCDQQKEIQNQNREICYFNNI